MKADGTATGHIGDNKKNASHPECCQKNLATYDSLDVDEVA